jgi:Tol biopolymer transport system component
MASTAALGLLVGCGTDAERRPSLNPSSARIAFIRATVGAPARYDLATADSNGRNIDVLTGHRGPGGVIPALFGRPAWSPDGRQLAFTASSRSRSHSDIYLMDAGGGHQRRVTRLRDVGVPLWSRDATKIIFTRFRRGRSGSYGALWQVSVRGGKVRRLTESTTRTLDIAGAFSADGQTLLFTRWTCVAPADNGCVYNPAKTTRFVIYAAQADGSRPSPLIRNGSVPALSPNGSRVAYASGRDRNGLFTYGDSEKFANELYVANADGTHRHRITRTRELNESSPSWRDDNRITFEAGKEIGNAEGTSLFEISADGTCRRTILADPKLNTWYTSPTWQPTTPGSGARPSSC